MPNEHHLVCFRRWLLENYRVSTASTYLTSVKLFFAWLGKYGTYQDIARNIPGIKVDRTIPMRDYLGKKEIQFLLKRMARYADNTQNISDMRNYLIVLLMVSCGLRVSEITHLNVEDLYMTSETHRLLIHGKGRDGKSKSVNVPNNVVTEIFRWFEMLGSLQRKTPMFMSLGRKNPGGRLCARTISQIVKRALREAGFDSPRLTAHSLRHSAVTLALLAGASLQEAQQFARHRKIETTQIYAHNLESQQNRCSRLIVDMVLTVSKHHTNSKNRISSIFHLNTYNLRIRTHNNYCPT